MRKVVILLIVFAMPLVSFMPKQPGNTTATAINWITIEEAEKLTREKPKHVFVDVYTDWCGWCKKMDKSTFADPEVVKYVNKYFYAVKLNAESDEKITVKGTDTTARQLAASFRVTGYPTIVFIDKGFDKVTPVPGYKRAEEFKKILVEIIGS